MYVYKRNPLNGSELRRDKYNLGKEHCCKPGAVDSMYKLVLADWYTHDQCKERHDKFVVQLGCYTVDVFLVGDTVFGH